MNAVQTVPVHVETHGRVPKGMRELAVAKVGSLLRFASEPVLSARVTLAHPPTRPCRGRRSRRPPST